MVKKLFVLLLSMMLTLCIMAPALAQSQDEFELSCREKTAGTAMVYTQGDAFALPVEMLPAGTYVQVIDYAGGGWTEILWMSGGVCRSGWTDAELESCMESVRDECGFLYEMHENDPEYDEMIDLLETEGFAAP